MSSPPLGSGHRVCACLCSFSTGIAGGLEVTFQLVWAVQSLERAWRTALWVCEEVPSRWPIAQPAHSCGHGGGGGVPRVWHLCEPARGTAHAGGGHSALGLCSPGQRGEGYVTVLWGGRGFPQGQGREPDGCVLREVDIRRAGAACPPGPAPSVPRI